MRLSSTEPSNHSRILKNPSKTIKPSSQEAEKALAYVLFLYSKTRIWGSGGSILGVRQANFEGSGGRFWGSRRGSRGRFWGSRPRFWVNFGCFGCLRVDFDPPRVDFGSILGQFWGLAEIRGWIRGCVLGQFWVNSGVRDPVLEVPTSVLEV